MPTEYGGIEIKNYMEDVVQMTLKDMLKRLNICKCDKCLSDITAMALNALPCKYYITAKGGVFSKLDTLKHQYEVDVVTALTKAINRVSGDPRHDNN